MEGRGWKEEPQRSRVTENERGDANAGQTLNDFHCFQKLSYQREPPALSVFLASIHDLAFPPRPFPPPSNHLRHLASPRATRPRCAVYKPHPTCNGTFFNLFPGKVYTTLRFYVPGVRFSLARYQRGDSKYEHVRSISANDIDPRQNRRTECDFQFLFPSD